MTDNPIKTRREGGIIEVTLDRPKANAIDLKTSRIMGETFRAFRDDPDLRVAILRAEVSHSRHWTGRQECYEVGNSRLPRARGPCGRYCGTRAGTSSKPTGAT